MVGCVNEDIESAMAFMSRCFDTLESISTVFYLMSAFPPASVLAHPLLPFAETASRIPALDLSKATKLKDVDLGLISRLCTLRFRPYLRRWSTEHVHSVHSRTDQARKVMCLHMQSVGRVYNAPSLCGEGLGGCPTPPQADPLHTPTCSGSQFSHWHIAWSLRSHATLRL